MAFTYRADVNRPLDYSESDANWAHVETLHAETLLARDIAVAYGDLYADTAAGLAATTNGQYFSVPGNGSPDVVYLYKNNAGTATLINTYKNSDVSGTAIVMDGHYYAWALTPSGGTAEQPAVIVYAKGVERVRATLTWGTTGGAAGNVATAVYEYSANSGTNYSSIGTKTMTYDAAGNVTLTAWS